MIVRLVHALQSIPPYGLLGLRSLFDSERTCAGVPLAVPGSPAPHSAHSGFPFLRLL
jgi:hypothetical protein